MSTTTEDARVSLLSDGLAGSLAGGAIAGIAAMTSMPKAAGAVAVERGDGTPAPLTRYGEGTFGRLFPRLPAFGGGNTGFRGEETHASKTVWVEVRANHPFGGCGARGSGVMLFSLHRTGEASDFVPREGVGRW